MGDFTERIRQCSDIIFRNRIFDDTHSIKIMNGSIHPIIVIGGINELFINNGRMRLVGQNRSGFGAINGLIN